MGWPASLFFFFLLRLGNAPFIRVHYKKVNKKKEAQTYHNPKTVGQSRQSFFFLLIILHSFAPPSFHDGVAFSLESFKKPIVVVVVVVASAGLIFVQQARARLGLGRIEFAQFGALGPLQS